MIEVTARLLGGPVYLSGEVVECHINFCYPLSVSHSISQSHNKMFENLAWSSVQISCICSTDSKSTKKDESSNQLMANETSLWCAPIMGNNEMATKPRILFCDLRLAPGQSKTFIYKERISPDSPPSYRGQLVKYSYKLIIGMQKINSRVKLLYVPLRVLSINTAIINEVGALCNDTTEDLAPANPFLEVKQANANFGFTLQTLQNITARRKPNFYMITNTWGKVARFCLFKSAYKLGEDIIGTFDFTVSTVTCVQYSVSLQCEEENCTSEKSKQVRILTFNKHHEVCSGLKYTHVILPIPLHVTPDFSTSLISLKWRLHFEFVTSKSKELEAPGLDVFGWSAPTDLPVETMVWSLPIKVFSTTPTQVAQGVQMKTVYKMVVH